MSQQEPPRLIRMSETIRQVGLKKTSIYDLVKKGDFPAPVRIADRAAGFVQSEVSAWVEGRIRESRKAG